MGNGKAALLGERGGGGGVSLGRRKAPPASVSEGQGYGPAVPRGAWTVRGAGSAPRLLGPRQPLVAAHGVFLAPSLRCGRCVRQAPWR